MTILLSLSASSAQRVSSFPALCRVPPPFSSRSLLPLCQSECDWHHPLLLAALRSEGIPSSSLTNQRVNASLHPSFPTPSYSPPSPPHLPLLRPSLSVLRLMDGELKGTDQLGNQYYENLSRTPGRQRFIIYAGWGKVYDPSMVPAEWHHWLHSTSDRTPVERPVKPYPYQLQHQQVKLSHYGNSGNYSPPGAWVRQEPKTHSSYNVWEKDSAKDQDNSGTQPRV